jgi:hypothetical protein
LRLPECEVNVVAITNKDSLEMTDPDRLLILGMVRAILKKQFQHFDYAWNGHDGRDGPLFQAIIAGVEDDDRAYERCVATDSSSERTLLSRRLPSPALD